MTLDSSNTSNKKLHVVVIVLGDLGRSPRMQYHCLSLLQNGHRVTFVGYAGEELIPALVERDEKQFRTIRFRAPKFYNLRSYALSLYFVWRILSVTILLMTALLRVDHADLVLIQNPPAVPLLALAVLFCRLTRAALVIDWHNLGFSMIPSANVWMRHWARKYEEWWAPRADGHLVVTRALRDYLISDMGVRGHGSSSDKAVNVSVLLDCPPPIFRLRTIKEQHLVLKQVDLTLNEAWARAFPIDESTTLFTEEYSPGRFRPRANRPALIVSSTSWTRDEDIGILIDACILVDQIIQKKRSSLKIVCCITGKGPLQQIYQEEIAQRCNQLSNVMIKTLWIPPAEYPAWVGCADLGISLHTSTSGRDLPIKILDYFGCEVPVCAYQFSCLRELVQDDVNGRTFTTAEQLSGLLYELLQPLTHFERIGNHDFGELKRYSLQVQGRLLWNENWPKNAWPLMASAVVASKNRLQKKQHFLKRNEEDKKATLKKAI